MEGKKYSVVIDYIDGASSNFQYDTIEVAREKLDELHSQIAAGWKFAEYIDRITFWDNEEEDLFYIENH